MTLNIGRDWKRGRGRGFFKTYDKRDDPSIPKPTPRDLYEGLLPGTLRTIDRPRAVEGKVEITDLHYIGSYNWIDATKPTILVPGSPRVWKNKPLPFQVQADQGVNFIDQNGYRLPSATLLPLFRAVDAVAEENADADIDWQTVDIVTDRNGLRKLLRWIDERGDGDRPRDFRIDLQLAGEETVLMNRWQETTWEPAGHSYGYSFEKISTEPAPDCERSTGHHRIVQYDFGGLNLVVRFEVDACLVPLPKRQTASSGGDVDDVVNQLTGLSLSSMSTSPRPSVGTDVTIIRAGNEVPQSSIIEMATRSELSAANFDWAENYPRLYLSQTPHHYLAIHKRGFFNRIEKRQLEGEEIKQTHAKAKESFKKLRALLGTIQGIVLEYGKRGRLTLICKDGVLEVREREGQTSCLPDDVMKRFGL